MLGWFKGSNTRKTSHLGSSNLNQHCFPKLGLRPTGEIACVVCCLVCTREILGTPEPHLLSGWPKKSQNFIFATKMVFPKSLKFLNSGSEELISPSYKYEVFPPKEISIPGSTGIPAPNSCTALKPFFETIVSWSEGLISFRRHGGNCERSSQPSTYESTSCVGPRGSVTVMRKSCVSCQRLFSFCCRRGSPQKRDKQRGNQLAGIQEKPGIREDSP